MSGYGTTLKFSQMQHFRQLCEQPEQVDADER
jgi:hypothetical protein